MTILPPKEEIKMIELSAININEEEREYILYATASGLRREDLRVSVERKVLTVSATGNEEKTHLKKSKHLRGRVRTFTLPDNADPLLTCATYNNGSLEIHIPKGENTEEKPLLIHVY